MHLAVMIVNVAFLNGQQ